MKRAVLLWLVGLSAACSDHSFAVVSVLTYSGSLDDVSLLRVHVSSDSSEQILRYPEKPSRLRVDSERGVSFSVEFAGSRARAASFEVEALSGEGAVLAYGKVGAMVGGRDVVAVSLRIAAGAVRPALGSVSDGTLACTPSAPAAACGADRTCALLCIESEPAIGMCYLSGTANPGDSCRGNNDCAPGSQCFTFNAVGCSVMTCRKFCESDGDCGRAGAFCNLPIPCGSTGHFTACSQPCDPSLGATSGCAAGLACFVYAGDSTDCACPGLGSAGTPCTQNSGCSGEAACSGCGAGLSCVIPTGSTAGSTAGVCRPVCKLAAPSCPTGTTCRAFDNSVRQLYGFCQ